MDVKDNNTYLLRHCDNHKLWRSYVHANRLKKYKDPTQRQTNPVLQPLPVTITDDIIFSQQQIQQQVPQPNPETPPSEPIEIEKIYKCIRYPDGTRWYKAKIKSVGVRKVSEDLVPQLMREQYHIQKTMKGKARKKRQLQTQH